MSIVDPVVGMVQPVEPMSVSEPEPEARCTGHCCRTFHLPFTPEHIRMMREVEVERGLPDDHGRETVADMLIPTERPHFWNCKHLVEGQHCSIYEKRPRMCRDYPYREPCQFEGCTYRPPPPTVDDEPTKPLSADTA